MEGVEGVLGGCGWAVWGVRVCVFGREGDLGRLEAVDLEHVADVGGEAPGCGGASLATWLAEAVLCLDSTRDGCVGVKRRE